MDVKLTEEILKFIEEMVKQYPNDTDLGYKLRKLYIENAKS
jgi:hypothetical protein